MAMAKSYLSRACSNILPHISHHGVANDCSRKAIGVAYRSNIHIVLLPVCCAPPARASPTTSAHPKCSSHFALVCPLVALACSSSSSSQHLLWSHWIHPCHCIFHPHIANPHRLSFFSVKWRWSNGCKPVTSELKIRKIQPFRTNGVADVNWYLPADYMKADVSLQGACTSVSLRTNLNCFCICTFIMLIFTYTSSTYMSLIMLWRLCTCKLLHSVQSALAEGSKYMRYACDVIWLIQHVRNAWCSVSPGRAAMWSLGLWIGSGLHGRCMLRYRIMSWFMAKGKWPVVVPCISFSLYIMKKRWGQWWLYERKLVPVRILSWCYCY
jgi:hypothetical protein